MEQRASNSTKEGHRARGCCFLPFLPATSFCLLKAITNPLSLYSCSASEPGMKGMRSSMSKLLRCVCHAEGMRAGNNGEQELMALQSEY